MPRQSLDDIFGSVQQGSTSTQTSRPSLDTIFSDTQQGATSSQAQVPPSPEKGVFSRIGDKFDEVGNRIGNFGTGFAKEAASLPFKAAELGSNIGTLAAAAIRPDATYEQLKAAQSGSGIQTASARPELFKPQGADQQMGADAEQLAELFLPVGAASKVGLVEKAASLSSKSPKVAKVLGFGTKVLTEGAEQASRAALQEGELNKNVSTAGLLGAATPIVSGTIGKLSDKLGNAIFSFTVPTTPGQRAKDFGRALDVGEAVSKTGVSISKGSLLNKIRSEAQQLGGKLDDVLSAFETKNPNAVFNIDDVAQSVSSELTPEKLAKTMQISPVDVPSAREAVIKRLDEYKSLYAGKDFTVKDLQGLKVSMGNALEDVYKKALDAPLKAKALTDVTLRSSLRRTIQNLVPETETINKALAPLLESEGRILAKGAYSGYLTDIIAGSLSAGSAGDILADPVGYGKRFLTGVIAKRLGTSTAAKTLSGTVLKDASRVLASPQFTQVLRRMVELSGNKEEDNSRDANQ